VKKRLRVAVRRATVAAEAVPRVTHRSKSASVSWSSGTVRAAAAVDTARYGVAYRLPCSMVAAYPAPRALVSVSREGPVSMPLLGLSVLAAALLLPEVWRLVPMQLAGPGGEHASENHWILTATLECMLIAGGLLAATRRPGWKALGIIVGLAFVYLGVASISRPYYAGSWNLWGGALATEVAHEPPVHSYRVR